MNLIEQLESIIQKSITNLGYEDNIKIEVCNKPEIADYQYNGCFGLAKKYGKNPNDIAEELTQYLTNDNSFSSVSHIGGFVNLRLSDSCLVNYINQIIASPSINTYHVPTNKTIFLDYGGANVAKELHVGHLRSANIGEALKRLCNYVGYKTISDVHLGDWGRPMGLIIKEIKTRMPDLVYFDDNYEGKYPSDCPVTLDELNKIYPIASIKAKEDEDYLNDARKITTELQQGNKGYYALWKTFRDLSCKDIAKIYDKLNATFDLWEGESDAEKYIPEMMKYLSDNNLTQISEGATIIDVKEDSDKKEMPPVILIKSDGGILYDTTEMATLYERVKKFNPDVMFYLTDIRQELHFVQAFRAGYKTKIVPESTGLEFLGFGAMTGPDGKPFKTRDGGIMSLNELLNMVTVETRKLIKDNIEEKDKDSLAEELAIAAIKYADLLPNRASDYVFDPIKFSDLNGKTGPYVLYGTVRMQSLLNKCKDSNLNSGEYKVLSSKEERDIILNIIRLKEIIQKSLNARSLNDITDYIYKLTNSFNAFYGAHEVLNEQNSDIQESYITLTNLVYNMNKELLDLLGIKVPEKI